MIFIVAFVIFTVGAIVRVVHDNGLVLVDPWLWMFSGSALVALGLFLYHGWPHYRSRVAP